MRNNNKKVIGIVIFIFVLIVIIGTSFALWQLTFRQSNTNVISTDCFKVEFTDDDPVNLQDAVPILDDDGKKLTPYRFTLTNMCDSLASYDINLETLNTSTLEDVSYIKMLLNEGGKVEDVKLLTSNDLVEKTLNDANSSYRIGTGYLSEKQSKTFELRLWLSDDTPTDLKYMSKTFNSKVTIVTSFTKGESIENRNIMMGRYSDDGTDNFSFMIDSKQIVFRNKKTDPTGVEKVDISYNKDNSVIAYSDTSSGSKITYIEANGKIKFPVNSNRLFYQFMVNEISGLEYVDTSSVTDMSLMFDQSQVVNLDLSSFDTSNVTDMHAMFYQCHALIKLNLSGFDTSNVTNMNIMFDGCFNLVNLNISDFDTSNVTGMNNMFYNCKKLIATITIRNTELTDYSNIFMLTAIESGAQLTVNYTTETEELVDKMIATKYSSSNVVKGIKVD